MQSGLFSTVNARLRYRVRYPVGERHFSYLHTVQTGSLDHLDSYAMSTGGGGGVSPGKKRQGREVDHWPPSSVELYLHFPIYTSSFTFSGLHKMFSIRGNNRLILRNASTIHRLRARRCEVGNLRLSETLSTLLIMWCIDPLLSSDSVNSGRLVGNVSNKRTGLCNPFVTNGSVNTPCWKRCFLFGSCKVGIKK
jgi:hypothetical protein